MKINTGTNKNQAQSRKFNIAQLTRKVSTPVFRGSVRKLCAHLLTRVFELLHERKCLYFHEMLSKKHTSSLKQKRIEIHSPQLVTFRKQEFRSATWVTCVADALNLLYRLYKWFRRVRGPAATQATTWVFMFSSKLTGRQNGCTVLATTKYN